MNTGLSTKIIWLRKQLQEKNRIIALQANIIENWKWKKRTTGRNWEWKDCANSGKK